LTNLIRWRIIRWRIINLLEILWFGSMKKPKSRPVPVRQTIESHARRIPEVDVSAVETYLLLLRTGEALQQGLRTNLARYGLNNGSFRLLVFVLEELEETGQWPTPSQLAERAGLAPATVTDLLDSLERAKLIMREEHPNDRRGVLIRLTEAGRESLDKNLPDHFKRISLLMSDLSSDEQHELRTLLKKVSEKIPAFSQS
jgi:DNA-binding MarR family transcriptional regulator